MATIEFTNLTAVPVDHFNRVPAGEQAIILTNGVVLHPELATLIPRKTTLLPLTDVGDEHTYRVTVRGYTVEKFVAIATAYMNEDFKTAERLVSELNPRER